MLHTHTVVALTLMAAIFASSSAAQEPAESKVELLWPQGAPGALGDGEADKPTIGIYLPDKEKATGVGIVVLPGGGYGGHAMGHEGKDIAAWLNSGGIAAFVTKYRLKTYRHPVPLMDAQRAIRTVRARAGEFGVDPDRVGVIGFSAGGHLASTTGTHFDAGRSDSADKIEQVSSRPDFMILCYPVISFQSPFTHRGSLRNLLGDNPDPKLVASLSNETQVTPQTPPTFLFHTSTDTGVPPENSIVFYQALRAAGVPAEMHIYEQGKHGVGLAPNDPVLSSWPKRCEDWLRVRGVLK